jgi:hypothetical protein
LGQDEAFLRKGLLRTDMELQKGHSVLSKVSLAPSLSSKSCITLFHNPDAISQDCLLDVTTEGFGAQAGKRLVCTILFWPLPWDSLSMKTLLNVYILSLPPHLSLASDCFD